MDLNNIRLIKARIVRVRDQADDLLSFLDDLERRLDKKRHRWWDDDSPQSENTFGVR